MPTKKTINDYHALAQKRGFVYLGDDAPDLNIRRRWRCPEGHEWETNYNNIRNGKGCHICGGSAPLTAGDYADLATKRGYIWLGPFPKNNQTKTRWSCGKHEWESSYGSILMGSGCVYCNGRRLNPLHYHELAASRGFTWLGPMPKDNNTKTRWSCGQHEWETNYQHIKKGTGCPHCSGMAQKTEDDYRRLGESRGLTWLGPLPQRVDVKTCWSCGRHEWHATYSSVVSALKGCPYCSGGGVKKRPEDYEALATSNGFTWLGPFPETTEGPTHWSCGRHEWETNYQNIKKGTGCPHCPNGKQKTEDDYRVLAESKGLTWLGPWPGSVNAKTRWTCGQHEWITTYENVLKSTSGCPRCAKHSGQPRKTAAEYEALAKSKGLTWLGPWPSRVNTKTRWTCGQHEWETSYASLSSSPASGCPYCAGNARKTEPEYLKLAEERGVVFIGPMPSGVRHKTWWRCHKSGHLLNTSYHDLHRNLGCPECVGWINGVQTSKLQTQLAEMLGAEINYPEPPYFIDCALASEMIAIEYDGWYFHKDSLQEDRARAAHLIELGWRVLSVKSRDTLPSMDMLADALQLLNEGQVYVEIVMPDWKGYDDE